MYNEASKKVKIYTAQQKRDISLDLLRTMAILDIILAHAVESTYPMNVELISFPTIQKILALSMHTLGRLGVPIFFFLTGYLLLDRDYDDDKIIGFWKTHLLQLMITSEILGTIYYIFGLSQGIEFSLIRLFREMLMHDNFEAGHFWYIPKIIGIYLFLPFVAKVLKDIDIRRLPLPL